MDFVNPSMLPKRKDILYLTSEDEEFIAQKLFVEFQMFVFLGHLVTGLLMNLHEAHPFGNSTCQIANLYGI
jgi:hypothetical protein